MKPEEKPQQAVVAYIRRSDGKLLSITRKDTGQHSAPGGKVEPNELRLQALIREVREEVGVYIEDARKVYEGLRTSGRRVTAYLVSDWIGHPTACEPGTRVEWVDPIEIANGFDSEYHTAALKHIGMIQAPVNERRAPVQGDYQKPKDSPGHEPGTIAWEEHEEIWRVYAAEYGKGQSAERIAEPATFGDGEIVYLTGSAPKTWQPLVKKDKT